MSEKTFIRYSDKSKVEKIIEPFEEDIIEQEYVQNLTNQSKNLRLSLNEVPRYYARANDEICTIGGQADWVQDFQYEKCILKKSELIISDSLRKKYSRYGINNLTSGKYKLFSIQIGLAEHLSYIVKNNKIINLEEMSSYYFCEIYSLENNKYLLIKRNDNMSISCYSAIICNDNSLFQEGNSNVINSLGKEILSVCSSTVLEKENGLVYQKPIRIQFNPKTKNIFYTFTSIKNGENITRRAKYKNGTFSIKSYNEVLSEE